MNKIIKKLLALGISVMMLANMNVDVFAAMIKIDLDGGSLTADSEGYKQGEGDNNEYGDDFEGFDITGGDKATDGSSVTITDTGRDMTVNITDATITGGEGENGITIDNGDSDISVSITDSTVTGGEGGNGVDITDGEGTTDVTIKAEETDTTITAGEGGDAGLKLSGDAEVTVSTEDKNTVDVIGDGTGVELNDGSSLTVSEDSTMNAVGNINNIDDSTERSEDGSVSAEGGTGIEMNDTSSVTVDGTLNAEGSATQVSISGVASPENNVTVKVGESTGIEMNGDSTLTDDGGTVNATGAELYVDKGSASLESAGSTGIEMNDNAEIAVTDGGEVTSEDVMTGKNPSNYNVYTESAKGNYILVGEKYLSVSSNSVKALKYKKNKDGTYTKYTYGDYILINNEYVLFEDLTRYTSTSTKAKISGTEGEGTGIEMNGGSSISVNDGEVIATSNGSAIDMNDTSSIAIDGKSTVVAATNAKDTAAITMDKDASISISTDTDGNAGMLYAQTKNATDAVVKANGDAAELAGYEAVEATGTGLHYVSCDMETDEFKLYWDIGADAEGDQVIDLQQMMVAALNAYASAYYGFFTTMKTMPGNSYIFDVVITSKSGNTYRYKDASFTIAPAADPDALSFYSARTSNSALRALYGINSGKIPLDKIVNVENYLKTTGYNGKTYDSLEAFYLDFYNDKYNTTAKKLDELPIIAINNIFSSLPNAQYMVTDDEYAELMKNKNGTYEIYVTKEYEEEHKKEIQIKENGGDLAQTAVKYFYSYILAVYYGNLEINGNMTYAEYINKLANSGHNEQDNYVGNYTNEELLAAADKYFAALTSDDPLTSENFMKFKMAFSIDGPNCGNAFQCYDFEWNNTITLEQISKPIDPTPVDPTPVDPTPVDPTPVDPTPVEPAEEITEPETPLAQPDDTADEVFEELPEEKTPLAQPETAPVTEDIAEIDVPMTAPQTSDNSSLAVFAAAGLVSMLAAAFVVFKKKKN